MVREGKAAKVAACKDAEVKSPVPGYTQTPVKGRTIDGMAITERVKPAENLSVLPVQRAGNVKKVSSVNVKDANQEFGKVFTAHIQNAHLERQVKENCPLPAVWKGVRGESPKLMESNVPAVREVSSMNAERGLTLEQLFSDSKNQSNSEK